MEIRKVSVSAGRVVNHPTETYSNLRPSLHIEADLAPEDDAEQCIKQLQAKAESLVEDHKNQLVQALIDIESMKEREREMARLESELNRAQTRLESLRQHEEASVSFFDQLEPAAADE